MSTENRRPHTVYLTDELWSAIERRHLELRLHTSAPLSKIEFIEQVLRDGLNAVIVEAEPRQERLSSESPNGVAPQELRREPPPKQEGRRGRRPTAVERLREASEPGRPARIRSAADGEDSKPSA